MDVVLTPRLGKSGVCGLDPGGRFLADNRERVVVWLLYLQLGTWESDKFSSKDVYPASLAA